MLNNNLAQKLRVLQSKKIRVSGKNVSFTEVINEVIQKRPKRKII